MYLHVFNLVAFDLCYLTMSANYADATRQLCRLGFERDLVIQAYFACDKNEELAANFLFDQPDDEGGEGQ